MNRIQAMKKADRLFSLWVRSVGICELAYWFPKVRCNGGLQCCHIISRRYRAIRWDDANALSGCAAHHLYGTHHPLEWQEAAELIGGYEALRHRALHGEPMDPFDVIQRLENLEDA